MMRNMELTVTIAGSYRKHLSAILRARAEFIAHGARVLRPASDEVLKDAGAFVQLVGDPADPGEAARQQLGAIRRSDLVYVVNPGGYIGASAMLEIGYACALAIPVVSSEPPFEAAASANVRAVATPHRAVGEVLHERLAPADASLLGEVIEGRSPGGRGRGRDGIALRAEASEGGVVVSCGPQRALRRGDGTWDMPEASLWFASLVEHAAGLGGRAAA